MPITYTIFERGDGRWVGRINLPPDPLTGEKLQPKYVYSSLPKRKGQQEVKRRVAEIVEQLEAGDMSQIYKITVKGWLEKYLKVYCADIEQTTRDGYEMYIKNHIIPVLGNIKLCDLKPIHIQNFYNHERTVVRGKNKDGKNIIGYSEKTLLQEHRILSRAFKKAVGDGLLRRNPCQAVDSPSPEDYEPTIYNEDEYLLLIDKLQGHKLEAIVLLAGMCGLRRGELLGLTWDNIDLENGIIKVHKNRVSTKKGSETKKPKTPKSDREFSIPSIIIPSLKRLRGIGPIITRLDGKEYHPGSVSNRFKEFLKENNLKHIRLHDLRHFNATMMLKNKVSDKEAASRLGHSSPAITKKIYQHVLEDMDRESANKLNNVFLKQVSNEVSEAKIKTPG